MIDGVILTPLKQIFDERGKVMHMLRSDSSVFKEFGEIYFSCTHTAVVKAWHLHKRMTLNYCVVYGQIKFVLYDDRHNSPIQRGDSGNIRIPRKLLTCNCTSLVWNGFKCVGSTQAIVANCSDIPQTEIVRKPPDTSYIPYSWDLVHR